MRECCSITQDMRETIPIDVIADYSLGSYDDALDGMLLSKYGLYDLFGNPIITSDFDSVISGELPSLQLCFCKDCLSVIDDEKHTTSLTSDLKDDKPIDVEAQLEFDTNDDIISPLLPTLYDAAARIETEEPIGIDQLNHKIREERGSVLNFPAVTLTEMD